MFGKTYFLGLSLALAVVLNLRITQAQEDGIPLRRGPRAGFNKEDEEEDTAFDFDEEDEMEEEEEPIKPQGQSLGSINFSTPDLDDDYHSPHLPSDMKCDACSILTYMMTESLDKANNKRPSLKKKLPESEIIDIFENICNDDFNNVGVKEINGKQHLSGPGSKIQDTPGIMQGGGKWPFRMLQMCQGYVGEYGEDELYQFYLDGTLKKELCHGRDGACRGKKDGGKKKADAKKRGGRKKPKVEL